MLENISFDQNLFLEINHIQNPALNVIMPLFSFIGSIYFTIVIMAVLWIKNPKVGALLVICLIINQVAVYGLKEIIMRPRPCQQLSGVINLGYEPPLGIEQWAFPSGHTNRIFTVATVGSYSMGYTIFWFLLSLIVGFSLIYVGGHFPLDVVAGGLLAVILSYLVLRWQKKFSKLIEISQKVHAMIFGRFKKNVPLS